MTPQEIFDKAYLGLKRQGKVSKSEDGACAYCGVEGLHCGVGFLVSDEVGKLWDAGMESSIGGLVHNSAEGVEDWMHTHKTLLEHIQAAHDSTFYWHSTAHGFESNFNAVAHTFGLTVPTMEEVVCA